MIFTLKDLTADAYTEVTVVQKEDGKMVLIRHSWEKAEL